MFKNVNNVDQTRREFQHALLELIQDGRFTYKGRAAIFTATARTHAEVHVKKDGEKLFVGYIDWVHVARLNHGKGYALTDSDFTYLHPQKPEYAATDLIGKTLQWVGDGDRYSVGAVVKADAVVDPERVAVYDLNTMNGANYAVQALNERIAAGFIEVL